MEDKTDINDQNYTSTSNRTSFRIEDILYRPKIDEEHKHVEKPYPPNMLTVKNMDSPPKTYQCSKPEVRKQYPVGYYSSGVPPGLGSTSGYQGNDGGYIQVAVGALGAYFGTPYKSISDPYFLTQGKYSFINHCLEIIIIRNWTNKNLT